MNKYRVTLVNGNIIDVEADSAFVGYAGQGAYGSSLTFYKNGDLIERDPFGRNPLIGEVGGYGDPNQRFKQIPVASFNLNTWDYYQQIEEEQVKAA